MTDWQRVVAFLRDHPDSSVMEIRLALWVSNVTGRMSDARNNGIEFVKHRDDKGVYRYSIVRKWPEPITGDQVGMAL